ncbi:aminotransferase class V-fold PLP-dependent enzyme [Streptomyces sp. NPDC004752]
MSGQLNAQGGPEAETPPGGRGPAYLNAGTLGPLRQSTVAAMVAELRRSALVGRGSDSELCALEAERERLRNAFAAVLGVSGDQIALSSSTTDGIRIVLGGLGLSADDAVVTTDIEHTSVQDLLDQCPAQVVRVPVNGVPDSVVVQQVSAAVTANTRLVVVSHVGYTTGQVLPIADLGSRLEVPLLVDGAQSVGAVACDPEGADYYTISGQKWLCGPEQVGALFIRHPTQLPVAAPSSVRFMGDGFGAGRVGSARDHDWCWLAGSTITGMLDALSHFSVDDLKRSQRLADECRSRLEQLGCDVGWHDSPLVSFSIRGDADEFVRFAEKQGVIIRSLPGPGRLRASLGVWNTSHDIDRLVEVVRDFVSES